MIKKISPNFRNYLFNWDYKFYFLVGGYGSGKSYHTALKIILKLLKEQRKALIVRNVFDTHRDSTFSLFNELIGELDISHIVKVSVSPLQINFKNGSKIIFKGMDKPEKLKSINNITLVWAEEASELKYDGFKELLGRLRHPSLPLYFILTTNPVAKNNWCYKHFFSDEENDLMVLDDEELYQNKNVILKETYYHHSTAEDNAFLPPSYLQTLDDIKAYDADLYRIARFGRFGINGIKVLPQFEVAPHNVVLEAVNRCSNKRAGMDFGFETSFNALVRVAICEQEKILYIYFEYYKNKMTDDKTAVEIDEFRRTGELIRADSAEPKTIKYYCQQGFKMVGAKKFPGSRLANIKKIKRFKKIICADTCKNTIRELKDLTYAKDRNGNIIEDTFAIDPHSFSAIWYALDGYEVADLKDRENYNGKGRKC